MNNRLKELLLLAAIGGAVALVVTGHIRIPGVGGAPSPAAARDGADERHAGYSWAAQRDIRDTNQCVGTSQSFIRGCLEYVNSR